jgi:hypothetical protein
MCGRLDFSRGEPNWESKPHHFEMGKVKIGAKSSCRSDNDVLRSDFPALPH